jgi:photosystem II stability/assembly factor-like uncharacterized protein
MKIKIQYISIALMLIGILFSYSAEAKRKKSKIKTDTIQSSVLSGLKWRNIGPAFSSGRIADFAVNPNNSSEYYVAVASGHVWKTTNNGTTFKPIFDNYGAYSMGCITIDPSNHNTIWLGTGENNHQRVIGYGNGVYKSVDGGQSWTNMGLKESRQIGGIVVHPTNSNIVYVAAEGSIWAKGGERGLYKTIDGGKTWEKILNISEHTGINNIIMDPRNPDVLYATSEQRRRHVFTKIGGGPESAVYKSVDGGKNWTKKMKGLPSVDIGGMGIAISPVNPDVLYLIVEAAEGKDGFFRSTNRGETWDKMSSYHSSGQYYNEIYCDPIDIDKVYSTETTTKVTVDGGKTWNNIGFKDRHVDDHALWIDPKNTKHLLIGGDGGIYETFDAGKNYVFKSNLPVIQYYRVSVDDSKPFYWIYGGTQDNNSQGGPNQNTSSDGVPASDWVVTLGGDGFWQAIEQGNPNIVYSEYQYGNVYRYDKQSGENIGIKPQPKKGEKTYKWNWNTPLILSPHKATRLYMAANKVFRSDDRGNNWEVISDDITAQIDRNTWPVMDRYWGADAVRKDVSTSLYGMAVSLAESKVQEGLLYVGTDDGVIQSTEDNGKNWLKTDKFKGVPENTYVSDILPSKFDANIVYASFNNLKRDDFKPYLLKSNDKGKTWISIAGNLPKDQTVHTIEQDFVNPKLLFVGTEFGVYFTINEGRIWTRLSAGIPDIQIADMTIHEGETDLVVASFGRGFFILDNYAPLRKLNKSFLDKDAYLFEVPDALAYIQTNKKHGQGATPYFGKNPDFGATFTYYIKELPKTLKQIRKEKEKELIKNKAKIPIPSLVDLRAEEKEIAPYLIFTIKDKTDKVVRKINKSLSKGINRLTWDLKYAGFNPSKLSDGKFNPLTNADGMFLVLPGEYSVSINQYANGEITNLAKAIKFNVVPLNNVTLPAEDRAAMVTFQAKTIELIRVVNGTENVAEDINKRIQSLKQVISNTPSVPNELMKKVTMLETEMEGIMWEFNGQKAKASPEENLPAIPSISDRLQKLIYFQEETTQSTTQNMKNSYNRIVEKFNPVYKRIKIILEKDIKTIEKEVEQYGAPYTPGRLPDWK